MMRKSLLPFAWLGWILAASGVLADEPEAKPAIRIRLSHPDQQLREVIGLFEGAKAPNPASALAAWKRASKEPNRLGKPLEALIAAINPGMIQELRSIDDAEVAIRFDPETGGLVWGAFLPKDDGTFAALATAMVLSGGAAEEPMGTLAVDRLGPPGSALMAKGPRALLLSGSREGLSEALARSERPDAKDPGDRLRFSLESGALEGSKSLAVRRLKAALGEPGGSISGTGGLVGSSFLATLDLAGKRPSTVAVVNPDWLAWVPADRASAAFALAIDPQAENWDAVFQVADRVERVDPLRENIAPLRLRLDLLARTLGVRTDADLLPHLEGITGWFGSDARTIESVFLMLHLDDEAASGRIFDRVKPLPNSGPVPAPRPGQQRWLGLADGRAVRLFRFGRSIALTWGDGVIEAALDARDRPDRSASRTLHDVLSDPRPVSVGLAWPGRLPGLISPDSPLARALAESRPSTWSGRWQRPTSFRLELAWTGIDATVKRFLDLIPLDPPPDH